MTSPSLASEQPSVRHSLLEVLRSLGPGLITGASDDDPSGIGTYSQVAIVGKPPLGRRRISYPARQA
jgi:hypothetical protein